MQALSSILLLAALSAPADEANKPADPNRPGDVQLSIEPYPQPMLAGRPLGVRLVIRNQGQQPVTLP